MNISAIVRACVSFCLLVAIVALPKPAFAGTTGGLTGTIEDATTKRPLAHVKITVASPSQIATATSDSGGRFAFLNLAPDTYTVSAQTEGYAPVSISGLSIVADNTRVLPLSAQKELKQIGSVRVRSASSLVRPGTTADVYSVSAADQAKASAAGGGGTQDSAFSALSTVPGVSVNPGQTGYIGAGPGLSIRGGDYDQVGYQFDGIPVNRSFDNYPAASTSSLGQQELQVYTGAPPPGTPSEGLAGFINQVIKTGTNPGFVTGVVGLGTPYYHKLDLEFGGVALDNRLSYYVGLGGYNQSLRSIDQFDGASLSTSYGYPFGVGCGPAGTYAKAQVPSCYSGGAYTPEGYVLLPINAFVDQSQVADRDTITNVHYYFPHKDGTRDDIQFLYDVSTLGTQDYSSANDLGGVPLEQAIDVANGGTSLLPNGKPNSATYTDGYQLGLATGGFLPANYRSFASIYSFPNVGAHAFDDQINPSERDGFNNDQDIEKLQFTKSLGASAFFRAYGYSYYSDWLNTGPNSSYVPYGSVPGDYELESHARGAGFQFSDQVNAQNLLSVDGDFTKASVVRDNNFEYENGSDTGVDTSTAIAVLVNGNHPTNGVCYSAAGTAVNCLSDPVTYNAGTGGAQYATLQQAYFGTVQPIAAASCGGGPCKYLVIGNGADATYNDVTPQFFGASLNDQFRPTEKLTFNLGLRLDDYQFIGGDTSGGPARAFWYNAYDSEVCESPGGESLVTRPSFGAPCPTGSTGVNFTNPTGNVTQTYPEFQPRFGLTYSITPQTVFRLSAGRYAQPPATAFEQYDVSQSNAPEQLYGEYGFQQYGFTTPNHAVPPAASNNVDFSIEQALPGQVSFKVSPFLRSTQDQTEQFFLDVATGFASGLSVGHQTSRGVEFELDKGDFSREGLSAKLAFTYTNNYVKYDTLSNGTTVLTPVVDAIKTYDSFTKAGGGSPCYTPATATGGGRADPSCASGDIANPYYDAPEQNPNAFDGASNYVPYDTIPALIGVSATAFGQPYVTSLVLNEKIKRFAIAPILQLFAGQRYGSPLATEGIDPTMCAGTLAGSTAGDPRYRFGAAGGLPYDATTCGDLAGGIPNLQTKAFDGIGAFVEPAQFLMQVQMSYEVSKNLTFTANLTNVVNTCFGGSKVPWKVSGACSYGLVDQGLTGGIGNTYNPGDAIQPSQRYSYEPSWNQQPFGMYVNANLRL